MATANVAEARGDKAAKAGSPQAARKATARAELAAATGPDGRIYALGGAYATGGVGGLHGDTIVSQTHQAVDEAYRPGAEQWTAISPLPTPRTQTAAATGSDGRIYVFGGFVILLASAGTATAVPSGPCRFVLGFQMLHALIPNVVGNCLDDEGHNPVNGDGLQHTTHGLLVWRKADNFTAFTDGYRTWVNGPHGVQERLNSQRFAWEANPDRLPVVPDSPYGPRPPAPPSTGPLLPVAPLASAVSGPLLAAIPAGGTG